MNSYPNDLAAIVDRQLTGTGVRSPGMRVLTELFEVMYFTSLKTEEGQALHCRIVYLDPMDPDPSPPPYIRAHRWKYVRLAEKIPFNVRNLSKLSRAVDPWPSSLAVYANKRNDLFIWGFIDQTVHFNTFIVRESGGSPQEPGLFQAVSQGTADLVVYRAWSMIARLVQNTILAKQNEVLWHGPVASRLGRHISRLCERVRATVGKRAYDQFGLWDMSIQEDYLDTLCRILINIQRYRFGGALLLTGKSQDLNIKYRVDYTRLSAALKKLIELKITSRNTWDYIHDEYLETNRKTLPIGLHLDEGLLEQGIEDSQMEVTGCVRFISSLSCVDGLILMRPDLTVAGFGTEITNNQKLGPTFMSTNAARYTSSLRKIDPNHFGTRHRSMMRFCQLHPASVGFVVSHDGDIRAITREPEGVVLWDNIKVHRLWEHKRETVPAKEKRKQTAGQVRVRSRRNAS
jgi:hypothetical protein